jgi:hypothetical protein
MTVRFLVDPNVLICSTLRKDSRYAKACEVIETRWLPGRVTENEKDFASIRGITIINPFD